MRAGDGREHQPRMLSLVEVAARQAYERARILPDAEMQRGRKTIGVLGTKLTAEIQSHAEWIGEQHCQSLRAAIGHQLPLVPFRFARKTLCMSVGPDAKIGRTGSKPKPSAKV